MIKNHAPKWTRSMWLLCCCGDTAAVPLAQEMDLRVFAAPKDLRERPAVICFMGIASTLAEGFSPSRALEVGLEEVRLVAFRLISPTCQGAVHKAFYFEGEKRPHPASWQLAPPRLVEPPSLADAFRPPASWSSSSSPCSSP